MLTISLKQWSDRIKDKGFDDGLEQKLINYVEVLSSSNLPVIFDSKHLEKILCISPDDLTTLVFGTKYFYRSFQMKKRTGGSRKIEVPYPKLMIVQYWIKEAILDRLKVTDEAHGFVPERSILSHVNLHKNSKFMLKIDIEDFFGSIKENWVINYFQSIGYSSSLSVKFGKLLTNNGSLIQGSPTSPILSNLLFSKVDSALSKLAHKNSIIYSRYADDLCFSGEYVPVKLKRIVSKILLSHHFNVNAKKTYYGKISGTTITGLKVIDNEVRVPRSFKREIRKEIYFIQKFGILGHLNKRRIRDDRYLEILRGKVNFWAFIEPEHNLPRKALAILNQLN